jgi:hypothetical protein
VFLFSSHQAEFQRDEAIQDIHSMLNEIELDSESPQLYRMLDHHVKSLREKYGFKSVEQCRLVEDPIKTYANELGKNDEHAKMRECLRSALANYTID